MSLPSSLPRRRRAALLILAVLTLSGLVTACSSEPDSGLSLGSHPIVVVDVGSLRADRLGAWGREPSSSPAVDRWAEEAALFEWAFSQSALPGPAQASLLTGLYPTAHGWREESGELTEETATLAETMREQGFATAAFVDGEPFTEGSGLARGFDEWQNLGQEGLAAVVPRAIEWLREHRDETFLLLIHGRGPVVDPSVFEDSGPPPAEDESTGPAAETAVAERYDAELRATDGELGRLFAALDELGLSERATVVLVSDRGASLGERQEVAGEGLAAPVTRIPLAIRLPAGQLAQRIEHPVEAVDLAPTLLELSGIAVPAAWQGDSLVPMLEGRARPRFFAYSEGVGENAAAVTLAGYQLVRDSAGVARLFHLERDPRAMTDVAALEPGKVEVLERHLDEWQRQIRAKASGESDEGDLDAETLEQLRNLGYIQ